MADTRCFFEAEKLLDGVLPKVKLGELGSTSKNPVRKKSMKIFDNILKVVGELVRDVGSRLQHNWGKSGSPWTLYLFVWALVLATAVVNLFDVILKWSLLEGISGAPQGFVDGLFLYPVGGRLLAGLIFIAAFIYFAGKSKAWLLTLSSSYFVFRFLDVDGLIVDSLGSRDTLSLVRRPDIGEVWPLAVTVLNALVAIFLVGVLINAFTGTRVFQGYRSGLRHDISRLRISEIILWVTLLAQVLFFVVMWVYLWVGVNAFEVMLTYPVLGRLLGVVVFGLLVAVSVKSRGFLLTLGVAGYLFQLLGIDAMLVRAFRQQDRIFGLLDPNLLAVGEMLTLTFFLLPVLLIWIALITIASVVRKRGRERINSWIDSRRESIYGVEDSDSEKPTRVSILAVFALITSIVFPLLGLVLAYAARNDFVAARPRKAGVDLAVAATIIGWFGLGVQLLFVIVAFVAGVFQGPSPIDLFFGLFQSLFGFGALTGGSDLVWNLIDALDS